MGYRSFALRFSSSVAPSGWMDGEVPWGSGELILSKKEATCVMGGGRPLLFAPAPFNPSTRSRDS